MISCRIRSSGVTLQFAPPRGHPAAVPSSAAVHSSAVAIGPGTTPPWLPGVSVTGASRAAPAHDGARTSDPLLARHGRPVGYRLLPGPEWLVSSAYNRQRRMALWSSVVVKIQAGSPAESALHYLLVLCDPSVSKAHRSDERCPSFRFGSGSSEGKVGQDVEEAVAPQSGSARSRNVVPVDDRTFTVLMEQLQEGYVREHRRYGCVHYGEDPKRLLWL